MNAGETIKVVRVELGLSQSEMAEKLGVNSQSISRWETGLHFLKKKIADRILKFAETADISEGSKKIIEEWLDAGRRYGVSAEDYGFPNIDQDLLCMIADTSVNAAYVIEADTYQVLYVNKATKKDYDY
ncbi:MAG: helix-turn-helix domain-containing protein [Lachnospira sp.]|nr:helix-turn-helix domain-containing protein [Lachnospira sp.]